MLTGKLSFWNWIAEKQPLHAKCSMSTLNLPHQILANIKPNIESLCRILLSSIDDADGQNADEERFFLFRIFCWIFGGRGENWIFSEITTFSFLLMFIVSPKYSPEPWIYSIHCLLFGVFWLSMRLCYVHMKTRAIHHIIQMQFKLYNTASQ